MRTLRFARTMVDNPAYPGPKIAVLHGDPATRRREVINAFQSARVMKTLFGSSM